MTIGSHRIPAASVTILAFVAVLAAARSAPSKQQIYAAGEKAGKWGIETYFVSKARGGMLHVALAGSDGERLGFVELPEQVSEQGRETTTISWKSDELEVVLDKAARRAEFKKNGIPMLTASPGQADQAAAQFMAQHAELVAVMTAVIDDLRALGAVQVKRHLPKQVCLDVALGGVGPSGEAGSEVGCGGQEHYSCGYPDWTRSGACESATSENAFDCSNGYCIGCCRSGDCDCACLSGDFLCGCCRRGTSCDREAEVPEPVRPIADVK